MKYDEYENLTSRIWFWEEINKEDLRVKVENILKLIDECRLCRRTPGFPIVYFDMDQLKSGIIGECNMRVLENLLGSFKAFERSYPNRRHNGSARFNLATFFEEVHYMEELEKLSNALIVLGFISLAPETRFLNAEAEEEYFQIKAHAVKPLAESLCMSTTKLNIEDVYSWLMLNAEIDEYDLVWDKEQFKKDNLNG